jgi:hypothetical protein
MGDMAVIHKTTMTPTKLELLQPWLPAQPWYAGAEREPVLSRNGGFRLDDPEGEVGIEFMVVTDESGARPVAYHVPLTYRGAPLDGAEQALIGTTEHGVLGTRWVYDGTRDPVLVGQLRALFQGRAVPQAQSLTDTPDPSVTVHLAETGFPAAPAVEVIRLLQPDEGAAAEKYGYVTAGWRLPDGSEHRGRFAVLRDAGA